MSFELLRIYGSAIEMMIENSTLSTQNSKLQV
jgi:hypothetical protein